MADQNLLYDTGNEEVSFNITEEEYQNLGLGGQEGGEVVSVGKKKSKTKKPPTKPAPKNVNRKQGFDSTLKKKLAAVVKEKGAIIWDLSHAQHYNINAINAAWKEIGSQLGKTCKLFSIIFLT